MSQLFERFSSRENLKKAYGYVQNELTHSSLSVNPINHPATTAVNDLGESFFTALEQYIRDGDYKPEKGFFVYMPKDNLGIRPVCILSMIDRIVYQAIFNQDSIGHEIEGQVLDKLCLANRISDDEKSEYFLSQYFNGWDDFCKQQLEAFDKGYSWKLEVDVQQYYEHIPVGKLAEKLKNDFGINDEKILAILKAQLCTWAEYPELPKGIPQGPNASAVLGNVYLSSLDAYIEKEFIGKKLRYFRYADDIVLMGKTKEDVLRVTEKVVRFLREHNLTLNEKTKLAELEDTKTIEAMRFLSDYGNDTKEIPEDDFARVQNIVPFTIASIQNGEQVDKSDIRGLKYFLKVGTGYDIDLITKLIDIIPLRPSLTVPIIQYVSEGRNLLNIFGNSNDAPLIDFALWGIYNRTDISEWSRFWVFKLLLSNKDVFLGEIDKEVEQILSSKENTIFKIVCFYYQAIQEKRIDIGQVKQAVDGSKTDVEKSLYSFFLLNAFQDARLPVIRNCIERLLTDPSHDLNLIGSYLFKNKPKASIEDFEGIFSSYLLRRERKSKKVSTKTTTDKNRQDFYMIRSENLIPITSPSAIFGVNRPQRKKHTIELIFPEVVRWEKTVLKIKDGLQDIEIWYDGKHIKTANYVELGFSSNKKESKPDMKWHLLCIFSALQSTNISTATVDNLMSMLANRSNHITGRSNVHQTKKHLSNALRAIFKTSDDPFIHNGTYYEPRMTILPEPALRNQVLFKQGGQLNENIDYGDTEE